jgi:nucleoside-diphosphate-sugar epimerase
MTKKIRVWTTGEFGNMARVFTRQSEFTHLMPPEEWRTYQTVWGRELDIRNESTVMQFLERYSPDLIYHAAAVVGSERVDRHSFDSWTTNFEATTRLFVMAHMMKIPMVYFSTSAIYDVDAPRPFSERSPVKPRTNYGIQKYEAEKVFSTLYSPDSDPPGVIIRPCFNYGGAYDRQSQLARFVRAARNKRKKFDVSLGAFSKKDWMRVEDTTRALTLIGKRLLQKDVPPILNISLMEPRVVYGFFAKLKAALNRMNNLSGMVPIEYHDNLDYLRDHIVDNTLLKSLGWTPIFKGDIGFATGIETLAREVWNGPDLSDDFTAVRE